MLTYNAAMSNEAFNKIIKEIEALTPDERRQLIDQLAAEGQHSQGNDEQRSGSMNGTLEDMEPKFNDTELSQSNSDGEETQNSSATLREWLTQTRNTRIKSPLTSDSVKILRELREARHRR